MREQRRAAAHPRFFRSSPIFIPSCFSWSCRAGRVGARAAAVVRAAFALTVAPAPAAAWDDVGHMTVARIAWERLSPAARARAVALLRAAPADAGLAQLRPNDGGPEARDRALFVRAATWADLVRDRREPARLRRYHRGAWHFSDTFWREGADGRPVTVPAPRPAPEHAVERITVFAATLRDGARSAPERAVALAWLLHLVGDIHQPLHASSRVTAASPTGDKGGNDVRVGGGSLHSVWDNAIDRSPGRRQGGGRRQGENAKLARAEAWAAALPARHPAARWAPWIADTLPAHWALESLTLAQRDAYPGVTDSMPLTPEYRTRVRAASDAQVTLAGYRLAALLERVLGG
jgi:hypothetical protein